MQTLEKWALKKTKDVLHILARQQTLKWQRKLVYCSGIKTVLLLALNEYNCQYIPAHMSSMSRHTVNGITLNSKFQHKQLCSVGITLILHELIPMKFCQEQFSVSFVLTLSVWLLMC